MKDATRRVCPEMTQVGHHSLEAQGTDGNGCGLCASAQSAQELPSGEGGTRLLAELV